MDGGGGGRVPYGSRGPEVIRRYARQDAAFLLSQGVKALVCACGTVSSVAGEELARRAGCPFIEVVGPAALAAQVTLDQGGQKGVMGTAQDQGIRPPFPELPEVVLRNDKKIR